MLNCALSVQVNAVKHAVCSLSAILCSKSSVRLSLGPSFLTSVRENGFPNQASTETQRAMKEERLSIYGMLGISASGVN